LLRLCFWGYLIVAAFDATELAPVPATFFAATLNVNTAFEVRPVRLRDVVVVVVDTVLNTAPVES
jgi:hypothetical protein